MPNIKSNLINMHASLCICFLSVLFYTRSSFMDEFHHSTVEVTVCSHVAGDWTETGEALWDAGGVCYHGDRECARASELQSKNPADTWLKSKGKKHHGTQLMCRNHHSKFGLSTRALVTVLYIYLNIHSVFWSCVVGNVRSTWKTFSLTWIEPVLLVSMMPNHAQNPIWRLLKHHACT